MFLATQVDLPMGWSTQSKIYTGIHKFSMKPQRTLFLTMWINHYITQHQLTLLKSTMIQYQ